MSQHHGARGTDTQGVATPIAVGVSSQPPSPTPAPSHGLPTCSPAQGPQEPHLPQSPPTSTPVPWSSLGAPMPPMHSNLAQLWPDVDTRKQASQQWTASHLVRGGTSETGCLSLPASAGGQGPRVPTFALPPSPSFSLTPEGAAPGPHLCMELGLPLLAPVCNGHGREPGQSPRPWGSGPTKAGPLHLPRTTDSAPARPNAGPDRRSRNPLCTSCEQSCRTCSLTPSAS